MRTRLAVLAIASLLVVAGVAITQPPDKGGPPRDKKGPPKGFDWHMLIQGLDLTTDQKAKVERIHKEHEEKMHEAVKKINEHSLQEMKDVLTQEQFEKFEKNLKKLMSAFKDFEKKGPPPEDEPGEPTKKSKKGPPPDGKKAPPPEASLRLPPVLHTARTHLAGC